MSFKCKIGLHSWDGCKCTECQKIRNEQHDWDGCKCKKCGETRDEQHDWSKDCEKCSICGSIKHYSLNNKKKAIRHNWVNDCEKCIKCGKTRENQHDWSKDCEKCSKCYQIKENQHDWEGCKCSKCSKTRVEYHDWSKDCEKCSICGKTRKNQHDYSKDCENCSKCGKSRDNQHNWGKDCEKCSNCGKTRDELHVWSKDCEKCSECGKTRENQHDWNGCKCSKCSKTRDEQHDWDKDCEVCSICGKTRANQHDWSKDSEKCSICGKSRAEQHELIKDKKNHIAKRNLGELFIQLSNKEIIDKYTLDAFITGWECVISFPRTWNLNETKNDIIIKPNYSRFILEGGYPLHTPCISLFHTGYNSLLIDEIRLLNDIKDKYPKSFKGFKLIDSVIIEIKGIKTLIMYFEFLRSSGAWRSITTIRAKNGSVWIMDVSGVKEDIKLWDSQNSPLHILSKLKIVKR